MEANPSREFRFSLELIQCEGCSPEIDPATVPPIQRTADDHPPVECEEVLEVLRVEPE